MHWHHVRVASHVASHANLRNPREWCCTNTKRGHVQDVVGGCCRNLQSETLSLKPDDRLNCVEHLGHVLVFCVTALWLQASSRSTQRVMTSAGQHRHSVYYWVCVKPGQVPRTCVFHFFVFRIPSGMLVCVPIYIYSSCAVGRFHIKGMRVIWARTSYLGSLRKTSGHCGACLAKP